MVVLISVVYCCVLAVWWVVGCCLLLCGSQIEEKFTFCVKQTPTHQHNNDGKNNWNVETMVNHSHEIALSDSHNKGKKFQSN